MQINLNTIITTILGGIIIWAVQNASSKSGQTRDTVNQISTALPFVQQSVTDVKTSLNEVRSDVKDAKATMVTRTELDNKHNRLTEAIKDVSNRQEKFQEQLDKEGTKGKR